MDLDYKAIDMMEIKQEGEDFHEIDNANLAKLNNSYSHIRHDTDDWNSFKMEEMESSTDKYDEYDIVTPAFEYIEFNKTVPKDEIYMDTLDQKVDQGIQIESSTSTNETCYLLLKGLNNESIMENEDPFELTIDTQKYIKAERRAGDLKAEEQKSEAYMDSPELQVLTEELDIKPDIDISNDKNLSAELARAAKKEIKEPKHGVIQGKPDEGSLTCYHCNVVVHSKKDLIHHINVGNCSLKGSVKKPFIACKSSHHTKEYICMNCHKNFKSKQAVDDHVIRNHEESIASVSSKIHQCKHCSYKTTRVESLVRHMTEHPESGCTVKQIPCIHCNKTFKAKRTLDDHIIKNHEEFIASVPFKIHQCKHCTYKTTSSYLLARHIKKHPESGCKVKRIPCIHCNKTFKAKRTLDDHVIKKHEDFIASVSFKIHQCTLCTYKTTNSSLLTGHLEKHPESGCSVKRIPCFHCDATFSRKIGLDDHVIKNHTEFIGSVSSKIHQCKHCTYKTTYLPLLSKHMEKHPESGCSAKRIPCIHCNKTFKTKIALDDHIIKNHAEFIASVSSKIHQCGHCTYRTTSTTLFAQHIEKHPESGCCVKRFSCIHCDAAFKRKTSLDDHFAKTHTELIASVQ